MKVIVTGASGFIGRNLVPQLDAPLSLSRADLAHSDAALTARYQASDAVVHLAGRAHKRRDTAAEAELYHTENVDLTRRLLRLAKECGVKHFIFLSTIGVHGTITTDSAFSEFSPFNPQNAYAESKIDAEELVVDFCAAHDIKWTILRPPLVYGDHAPGNIGALQKLLRKKLPLPFGALHNRRSLISVENLCGVIIHCLRDPRSHDQIYTLGDSVNRSTTQLLQLLAQREHIKICLLPVPVFLLKIAAFLVGKSTQLGPLWHDLRVDHSKSVTQLGWKPRP